MKKCPHCDNIHTNRTWCIVDDNNRFHSYDDAPATSLEFKKSGYCKLSWYKNGTLHRSLGPATLTKSLKDGKIIKSNYFLDGVLCPLTHFDVPFKTIDRVKSGDVWKKHGNHYLLLNDAFCAKRHHKMFIALENGVDRVFVCFRPDLEHSL